MYLKRRYMYEINTLTMCCCKVCMPIAYLLISTVIRKHCIDIGSHVELTAYVAAVNIPQNFDLCHSLIII